MSHRRMKKMGGVVLGLSVAMASLVGPTTSAHADRSYQVFGTGGVGVSLRDAPSLSANRVNGPAESSWISVSCQIAGGVAYGTNVWDRITFNGRVGYVTDAFVWTGYNGFDPRLPRCESPSPAPASSPAEKAARWAESHIGVAVSQVSERNGNQMTYWSGWCEVFAEGSYRLGAGVGIRSYATAASHAASKALQGGVPPRGALVFYRSTTSAGHVAVSVGGGNVVTTVGYYGQTSSIAKMGYLNAAPGYLGWYLP